MKSLVTARENEGHHSLLERTSSLSPEEASLLQRVAPSDRLKAFQSWLDLSPEKKQIIKVIARTSCSEKISHLIQHVPTALFENMTRIKAMGFDPTHHQTILPNIDLLTKENAGPLSVLMAGVDSVVYHDLFLDAIEMPAEDIRRFLSVAPKYRADIIYTWVNFTRRKKNAFIALASATGEKDVRKLMNRVSSSKIADLDFILGSNLVPHLIIPALNRLAYLPHEMMPALNRFFTGIPPKDTPMFLEAILDCRFRIHEDRYVESFQRVADAEFDLEHQKAALLVADKLTPENIAPLKVLLQGMSSADAESFLKNTVNISGEVLSQLASVNFSLHQRMALVPLMPGMRASDAAYLPGIFADVPDDALPELLKASVGKDHIALHEAARLAYQDRLAYLQSKPVSLDFIFEYLGINQSLDDQILIPHLQALLFTHANKVIKRYDKELKGHDRDRLERICDFILRRRQGITRFNFQQLGWNEDHPVVQDAIRKRTVLSGDITDPKNPWYIWNQMLERRAKDVDWAHVTPPELIFADKNVTLNPERIGQFSHGFLIDVDTVPAVSTALLHTLFTQLEDRLNESLRQEISHMQTQNISFQGLKNRTLGAQGVSFLTLLLNGKKTDFHSAKLMCVLNHLMTLPDADGTQTHLSTREHRFMQIVTNLRECDTGKADDLEELYNALPSDFKYSVLTPLFDWENISAEKRKGYGFLMTTVREGAFQVLSENNPLMRQICGLPEQPFDKNGRPVGEPHSISQLTHQTKYIINFVGRDIGVNHPDSFPHDAHLFYENMLAFEKTPLIKMYYDYSWKDARLMGFFRQKINEAVKPLLPTTRAASSSASTFPTTGFFPALDSLRPADMSIVDMWDVDENGVTTVTDKGLVTLLLEAGILKENMNALPWGGSAASSM
ncbi:MAG: hypothetical protein C0514_03440 [Candidatus Puniceispirillum sp.]|nr:hypothetical protein [Candidatus Puniceispirillum sp.]